MKRPNGSRFLRAPHEVLLNFHKMGAIADMRFVVRTVNSGLPTTHQQLLAGDYVDVWYDETPNGKLHVSS